MFFSKSLLFYTIKPKSVQIRFFFRVHHNLNRGTFYVQLPESERAVLLYKQDGKMLDMYAVNVPEKHKGQGLARLLAETAFTYAIVNHYYLYLTCTYLQKFYLATKTVELEEFVVGPPNILEGPDSQSLDPDTVYELPDPEDFMVNPSNSKVQ